MVSPAASRHQLDLILLQLEKARGFTLRTLGSDLEPRHLVYQVAPESSHLLWLAGHVAVSLDRLINLSAFDAPVLEADLTGLFGRGSVPMPDATVYPSLGEVRGLLDRSLVVAVERLRAADDSLLERRNTSPLGERYPLVGDTLRMAPVHESYHAGQMALLRRAQGLPAVAGG